tara:strand:- start:426 stop:1124 length:699 start_codon:yes stop_codon:yes gene_type:complete
MVQVSRKDLERLAIAFGIADFLSGGKLTAPIGNATRRAIVKAGPAIARGIVRYGPAAVGTAARVTPTGAVVSTAALLAIQNREKVAELAAQGYQVVAPAVQDYGAGVAERALDPETYLMRREGPTLGGDVLMEGLLGKGKTKRKSKFNQAVKKGMSIVKGSTSYGKKGTINNAKKAFTAVTKAASAVNKGRKAPKSGIRKKLHTAMTKIIGKKKKQTKKKSKIDIKVKGRDY